MSIEERLKKAEQQVNLLLCQKKNMNTSKPHWVKVTEVKKLTGWTKEDMRRARDYGYVKFKYSKETGFFYNLNSIHPHFLKQSI